MINRETLTISLPPKLLKEVRETAQKTGMTQSEFFRSAARNFLAEREWAPAFKGVEERVYKIGALELAKKLSPAERETLEIVFNKQAYKQILKSLGEARLGKLESIESILQ